MKLKIISLLVLACVFTACENSENNSGEPNLPAQDLLNVSYGSDAAQKMDVYLPANRGDQTKVFVLVHGGGWSAGSRADLAYAVPMLKAYFPDHAIVNLDYRLGTAQSPGFPKQIDDISLALAYLESHDYRIARDYGFIGASAGAHLSLLYAYHFDSEHNVKAVCSIVGPTDFTDPAYVGNPVFQYGLVPLVGNVTYAQNPGLFAEVSPATHVTTLSPATIQFNGGQDPLIPVTQPTRLKQKLDESGVYNEAYLYPNGDHGDWDTATMIDFQSKMVAFFEHQFN